MIEILNTLWLIIFWVFFAVTEVADDVPLPSDEDDSDEYLDELEPLAEDYIKDLEPHAEKYSEDLEDCLGH